jgi:hypothetical protein
MILEMKIMVILTCMARLAYRVLAGYSGRKELRKGLKVEP